MSSSSSAAAGGTATQLSERKQYKTQGIDEHNLHPSAFTQFRQWFNEADAHQDIEEAAAMTLSTVELVSLPSSTSQSASSIVGRPSSRVVLLKQVDQRGFVFYTNYESRKGRELERNPFAALTFYWPALHKSVRICGQTQKLTQEENDAYFNARPLGSRVGAIASPQSTKIEDRKELEEKVLDVERRFDIVGAAGLYPDEQDQKRSFDQAKHIDVPSYWGGYRVVPDEVEFWMGRLNRLHDRFRYTRDASSEKDEWSIDRLAP